MVHDIRWRMYEIVRGPRFPGLRARGFAIVGIVRELWAELSASMRALRTNAGMSLRKVEAEAGFGRGTLSQVETAKARPNRDVVEWYDTAFGGDGLLLSLYAEARGAHGPSSRRASAAAIDPADALLVMSVEPAHGGVVTTGSVVCARWKIRNAGAVPWRDRRLERVGARAGMRLVASDASVRLPDCEPGDAVVVEAPLGIPAASATYAATWQVVDAEGRLALPLDLALSVHLVARPANT